MRVPILGISMRPMHNAAFVIPFIFAIKFNNITHRDSGNPWSQVNIMGNQQRLTTTQAQDKSLVSGAIIIVRQNSDYCSGQVNLATV